MPKLNNKLSPVDEIESGLRKADWIQMQKGTETELTQHVKKKYNFFS